MSIYERLAKVPTPLGGLALGIVSYCVCLEGILPSGGRIFQAGAAIASLLLLCLFARFILYPKSIVADWQNPVLGSVLPTTSMALMLVAKAVSLQSPGAGEVLWLFAVGLHLFFLAAFLIVRIQKKDTGTVFPSWFIPPVGIIVASISCPSDAYLGAAWFFLWFGTINFLLLLPFVLYRLFFKPALPDPVKPTIAILAAPSSLAFTGFLSVASELQHLAFAFLLGGLGIILTAGVYVYLPRLLRLPFSPASSALTFPLVIGASGLYACARYMQNHLALQGYAATVYMLAHVEFFVCSVVLALVLYRYIRFYRA